MSDIVIEKGIPLPRRGVAPKYPFAKLEVGDSFFVPGRTTNSFGGIMTAAAKRTGYGFQSRKTDGGIRVWRIS